MKNNTSYTFQVFKGTHINAVLSAKDVDFLINSPISKEYFNWVENMEMSAEESYQSTLLRLYTNPMQVTSKYMKGDTFGKIIFDNIISGWLTIISISH